MDTVTLDRHFLEEIVQFSQKKKLQLPTHLLATIQYIIMHSKSLKSPIACLHEGTGPESSPNLDVGLFVTPDEMSHVATECLERAAKQIEQFCLTFQPYFSNGFETETCQY